MTARNHPLQQHLRSLAQLADDASSQGSTSTSSLPFFVGEATLWGVYAVLTMIAVFGYMRKRNRPVFKRWWMYLSMVMFMLATAHMGIRAWEICMGERRSHDWYLNISSCLRSLAGGDQTPSSCDDSTLFAADDSDASDITEFFLSEVPLIAISDVIVSWRACALWPRQWIVRGLSVLLFLGTLASLIYGGISTFGPGLPGSVLSWVTNLWSTSLISWKAWQHRRSMKEALGVGMARTKAESILLLFIDSGLLYAIVWMLIVISNGYVTATTWYSAFSLIQLVSIYPMATVVLAEYTDSYYERCVTIETIGVTHGAHCLSDHAPSHVLSMVAFPNEESSTPLEATSATGELKLYLVTKACARLVGTIC
ncbi:hypothetical protein PsYK624_032990 [Phanerochaete sordida]|uniref:Uncharacterized protein n=1 Tax=Phanerochaete sordida TaxID=48140 RepID=A0A9P3G2S6_9APHY|nr:hypothetical protein PsYK624_032990 [Phanerochaete sordida]